jgi:hypothetical protein
MVLERRNMLYHMARTPHRVLLGARRGQGGHEEAGRSLVPGAYFYDDREPERMFKYRRYRLWARKPPNIFPLSGPVADPIELEHILREAGYAGYERDGIVFLFGDTTIERIEDTWQH